MIFVEDDNYIIRNFIDCDLDDVYQYASDSKVSFYLTWPKHKNIEETKIILEKFKKEEHNFAIVLKSENKVIGSISLFDDRESSKDFLNKKSTEVGYLLNSNYQNRGIMVDVLSLLIEKIGETKIYDVIMATVVKENIRSIKVLEKCGFKHYKIIKDYYLENNDCKTDLLCFYKKII